MALQPLNWMVKKVQTEASVETVDAKKTVGSEEQALSSGNPGPSNQSRQSVKVTFKAKIKAGASLAYIIMIASNS